jgi:hypothetical protein
MILRPRGVPIDARAGHQGTEVRRLAAQHQHFGERDLVACLAGKRDFKGLSGATLYCRPW